MDRMDRNTSNGNAGSLLLSCTNTQASPKEEPITATDGLGPPNSFCGASMQQLQRLNCIKGIHEDFEKHEFVQWMPQKTFDLQPLLCVTRNHQEAGNFQDKLVVGKGTNLGASGKRSSRPGQVCRPKDKLFETLSDVVTFKRPALVSRANQLSARLLRDKEQDTLSWSTTSRTQDLSALSSDSSSPDRKQTSRNHKMPVLYADLNTQGVPDSRFVKGLDVDTCRHLGVLNPAKTAPKTAKNSYPTNFNTEHHVPTFTKIDTFVDQLSASQPISSMYSGLCDGNESKAMMQRKSAENQHRKTRTRLESCSIPTKEGRVKSTSLNHQGKRNQSETFLLLNSSRMVQQKPAGEAMASKTHPMSPLAGRDSIVDTQLRSKPLHYQENRAPPETDLLSNSSSAVSTGKDNASKTRTMSPLARRGSIGDTGPFQAIRSDRSFGLAKRSIHPGDSHGSATNLSCKERLTSLRGKIDEPRHSCFGDSSIMWDLYLHHSTLKVQVESMSLSANKASRHPSCLGPVMPLRRPSVSNHFGNQKERVKTRDAEDQNSSSVIEKPKKKTSTSVSRSSNNTVRKLQTIDGSSRRDSSSQTRQRSTSRSRSNNNHHAWDNSLPRRLCSGIDNYSNHQSRDRRSRRSSMNGSNRSRSSTDMGTSSQRGRRRDGSSEPRNTRCGSGMDVSSNHQSRDRKGRRSSRNAFHRSNGSTTMDASSQRSRRRDGRNDPRKTRSRDKQQSMPPSHIDEAKAVKTEWMALDHRLREELEELSSVQAEFIRLGKHVRFEI